MGINAFSKYNWKLEMLNEIQTTLKKLFPNYQEAFKFFCKKQVNEVVEVRSFDKAQFQFALDKVLPRRYKNKDINLIWQHCFQGKTKVT